jgi:hypothetical protein
MFIETRRSSVQAPSGATSVESICRPAGEGIPAIAAYDRLRRALIILDFHPFHIFLSW